MRRRIGALLAAALVLGCLSPALAAEPESAQAATDFDQLGPWGAWSQEQIAQAESWDEERWVQYWAEYDAWAWSFYDQYYMDYDAWSMDYYEDSLDYDWEDYLAQEKQELGMPYPEGINLSLNGEYLTLGGAQPLAVAGRVMVPARAFLEALGAQVDYQSGVVSASFENGDSLTFRLDSTQLEYVRGGQIDSVEMDVTPYVQGGSTYIPARFAAQAVGLDVYWDDTYEAVHLTDWQALADEIDSRFTCLNELLSASAATVDPDKTYATSGNFTLKGTLYGEEKDTTAQLDLAVSGLSRGSTASVDMTARLNLGGLRQSIEALVGAEGMELLDAFNGSKASLIVDGESGALYAKGSAVELISGGAVPKDAWLGTMLPMTIPSQITSMGELMVMTGQSNSYYRQSPWEGTMNGVTLMQMVLGDDNFTKRTSGQTTTYTLELDMLSLAKQAVALGVLDDFTLTDLLTGTQSIPTVEASFTAAVKDGKLDSFRGAGSVEMEGAFPFTMNFEMEGNAMDATASFAFKGAYVGKVEMTSWSTAAESSRTVPAAPPEGAEIIWK